MINEANIYKDVSKRLYDMMTERFKSEFKMFYLGAPSFLPPEEYLPCMVIHKASNDVSVEATGMDQMVETILINLIYSEKADFNNPDSQFQDTTLRKVHNLVEARDPDTNEWLTGTIMDAVRTNFTLESSTLGNTVAIDYDVTPRPDAPTILEAVISLTVTSLVEVPGRE